MICGYVDERCMPPDHDDSNYSIDGEARLADEPKLPAQGHRMRGEASVRLGWPMGVD